MKHAWRKSLRLSAHQPNFVPAFPFFYKMAMSDIFVILSNVQFEKNNFQNRYLLNKSDTWVTKSVKSGMDNIVDKRYVDGKDVLGLNMDWIHCIKETLGIETKIRFDYPTHLTKTERLIDLVQHYEGDTYLTNESAKDKYLDEELMKTSGIDIEYVNVPKHLQIHVFEAFEEFGIDGCIKQLQKAKKHAIS